MGAFTDRLALAITVDNAQALAGLKAVRGTAQTELSQTEKAATQSGLKTGEAYGNAIRKGFLAVGAIGISAAFLKSATNEALDAARANAQLQAVLKSTGGEAGVTATHVDDLSVSLSKTVAVNDDVIKRNAALLLTFRAIHNEVGAGNDIFDRATKASLDLSAAFGKDLQESVILVGKALNDPVRGLTSLQRVGVQFNNTQRAQIKGFVEAGDLLSAQKVVLKELEVQVGGTAAAIAKADPLQRLSVSAHEFKERVGKDAAPALNVLVDGAESAFEAFRKIPQPIRGIAEAIVGLGAVGLPVFASLAQVATGFAAVKATRAASAAGSGAAAAGDAGATAALAGAQQAEAVSAGEATVANTALTAALERQVFVVDSAGVAEATLVGTNGALAASETVAAEAATGLSLSLGTVVGGLAAVAGGALIWNQVVGGSKPNVDALTKSLQNYAATGELSGTASKVLGTDVRKLAGDLKTVDGGFLKKGFGGLGGSTQQATKDLDALRDAVKAIAAIDPAAARKVLGLLDNELIAQFGVGSDVVKKFADVIGGPLVTALEDLPQKAHAAAGSVRDLFDTLVKDLDKQTPLLAIGDAEATIRDDVDKLNQAKLDAVGTGEKATAAAKAERDANRSLQDAYRGVRDAKDRVRDATDRLADAQAKLNELNSPVGQQERALELDIIKRRVVTTPIEADQKTLDLLRFDQDNTDKQKSAEKALADAKKGVADANQGVADSQVRVRDAVDRVAEAEKNARRVQVDAAHEVSDLKRKAIEDEKTLAETIDKFAKDLPNDALREHIGILKDFAVAIDPNGPLTKGIEEFYRILTTPPPDSFFVPGVPNPNIKTAPPNVLKTYGPAAAGQQLAPQQLTINQTNNFDGGLTSNDLNFANQHLGQIVANAGRR